MIHKLDLKILRLMRYGKGKIAEKRFSPTPFIKRFGVDDFNFNDYKAFLSEFNKTEVRELINFTKDEITKLEAKLKDVKKNYNADAQTKFITPFTSKHKTHKTWGSWILKLTL